MTAAYNALPPDKQRGYDAELAAMRHVLETVEVVGQVRPTSEIEQLRDLAARFPDEAKQIISENDSP